MPVKVALGRRSDTGVALFLFLFFYSRVVRGGRFKEGRGGNIHPESDEQTGNRGGGLGGSELKGIDRGRAEPNSAMKHILLTS